MTTPHHPGPATTRPNPDRLTSESALIGAALTHPASAADVLDDLTPDDFADLGLALVMAAIRDHLQDGTPPEPALVVAHLHRLGVRPPSGLRWAVVIADTLPHAAVPAAAPAHRRALIEAGYRRQAADLARTLRYAQTVPIDELIRYVRDGTSRLAYTHYRLATVVPSTAATSDPTPGAAA